MDQALGMNQGCETRVVDYETTASFVGFGRCFLLWTMSCRKGKVSRDKAAEIGFVLLNVKSEHKRVRL